MLIAGRYILYNAIASGGMATVHLGRAIGAAGFTRVVAIKRLHPHLVKDPRFVAMFTDEARLAARIRHPNIVQTLDVATTEGELFVVMEYVHGDSLGRLVRASVDANEAIPVGVAVAIGSGLLHGLHAAHEARTERGEALEIVHRDVSPQNVMVGVDGLARVLDFGVAKAAVRLHVTTEGEIKGKIAYMAPEQLRRAEVTRRTDVYAASVVLWEMFARRRLFHGHDEGSVLEQVLLGLVDPPSKHAPSLPEKIDAIILRGLERDPQARFATAKEMAEQLEAAATPALASEVGAWVERTAGAKLRARAEEVSRVERDESAPTQPSTVAAGGRRRGRVGVAVAVAVGAVAATGFALSRHPEPPTPSARLDDPPIASHEPTAVAAPPVTGVPLASAPPADSAPTPSAASARAPRSGPRSPAPDCAIPFTIGPDGSKIYKRKCLR